MFVKGGGGAGWARRPFAACVRPVSAGRHCPVAGWSGNGTPFNGLVLVDHSSV